MIILCVSSIVTAFSPNMECFILLRAIIAGSAAAVYTLSYSYCEYSSGNIRAIIQLFRKGLNTDRNTFEISSLFYLSNEEIKSGNF